MAIAVHCSKVSLLLYLPSMIPSALLQSIAIARLMESTSIENIVAYVDMFYRTMNSLKHGQLPSHFTFICRSEGMAIIFLFVYAIMHEEKLFRCNQ
uniref:Uncharacterized protein n=1 Tax=Oryza brachyantha TaxID=4533 RepID=J3M832_ORYBR